MIRKTNISYPLIRTRKVALINIVAVFMMPAKLATLNLLKIKVFSNKIDDVHDVTDKILSRDSNYILSVVM